MTRKVLTIGKSSYAVTLPRSFIEEHDLKPGDDLHVTHEANTVHIRKHAPEHTISADLKNFTPERLRDMQRFTNDLLKTFFISGAQKVHLQNVTAEFSEQVRDCLQQARFYQENLADEQHLKLVCPVNLSADKTSEKFVKSTLQLAYTHLTDPQAQVREQLQDHLDQTRRAISQNLRSRKDLALYSFIEKIELVIQKIDNMQETPTYAQELANAIYCLQHIYTTETVPNFDQLVQRIHHIMDAEEELDPQEQQDARQLRIYLEHAWWNLLIHRVPT